jgi:hypothetical protein
MFQCHAAHAACSELYYQGRFVQRLLMWMTMIARINPDADPAIAFTPSEIAILDRLVGNAGNRGAKLGSIQLYLTKLARLGGYLARTADPPPGNATVWHGLRRLADIQLGAEIGKSLPCG